MHECQPRNAKSQDESNWRGQTNPLANTKSIKSKGTDRLSKTYRPHRAMVTPSTHDPIAGSALNMATPKKSEHHDSSLC